MLELTPETHAAMVAHALVGLPDEACGLMVGRLDGGTDASSGRGTVTRFEPCRNAAESSRIYTIEPREFLQIERRVDDEGLQIVGVMHSHTHTEPYPSVTDVNQAPDPDWHYVIVSLRDRAPMLRSYRIIDGTIAEEPVFVRSV